VCRMPDTDLPLVWPIVDRDVAIAACVRIIEALLGTDGAAIDFGRDRNDSLGAGLDAFGRAMVDLEVADSIEAAFRELIVAGPLVGMLMDLLT